MATDQAVPAIDVPAGEVLIPPLKAGDRLTRAEFERRYRAMPEIKKAELIAGVASSSASYDLGPKLKF